MFMKEIYTNKIDSLLSVKKKYLMIDLFIAMWALTEAALGGVLHAFQIPFTGLFVNSGAVLFMVLIASATEKKEQYSEQP